MPNLFTPGRFLFAIAITAFGIQHLIFAITGAGLGPPWTPVNHILAYFLGALFIASGVCMMAAIQVQCAGIAVALAAFIRIALCYLPKLAATSARSRSVDQRVRTSGDWPAPAWFCWRDSPVPTR